MSQFHGGYIIMRADPDVVEPVRRAAKRYLRRAGCDLEDHRLTFAARAGYSILHVAVRGGEADGKGYCFFHREHAALGGHLAKALQEPVYAYSYEDQVGTESVARFDERGKQRSSCEIEWDDVGHVEGVDFLLAPLADELGVPSRAIEIDLAYDTPVLQVALNKVPAAKRVARYFANLAPAGDIGCESAESTPLFFPTNMAVEIRQQANRLEVPMGTLVWAAWELAKQDIVEDAAFPMAAPPVELSIPEDAPQPPDLDYSKGSKVAVPLSIPAQIGEELRTGADATDRSLSWCAQAAWLYSRGQLLKATRSSIAPQVEMVLYFDEAILEDASELAANLNVSIDRLLSLGWDITRATLINDEPPINDVGDPAELLRFEPDTPTDVSIPTTAEELPPVDLAHEKCARSVLMSGRMKEELACCAARADTSLSRILVRSLAMARSRLAASEPMVRE